MTRLGRMAVAAVIVVAAATIGGIASAGERPDLPPADRAALARIFDAKLKPLGLRTTRAALQRLERYTPDPDGRHLAIYVEPTGDITDEDYVANFTKVARIFLPLVFERWSALRSFDVCQEPPPAANSQEEPPPVTQLQVTRRGGARIRWSRVALEQLIASSDEAAKDPTAGSRQRLFVFLSSSLNGVPALIAARAAATTITTAP